jgi:hypothetical protein
MVASWSQGLRRPLRMSSRSTSQRSPTRCPARRWEPRRARAARSRDAWVLSTLGCGRASGIGRPRCGGRERCGHHVAVPSSTLAGQIAIVTGASRGVGRQVALHLAEQGAALGSTDQRLTALAGNQPSARSAPTRTSDSAAITSPCGAAHRSAARRSAARSATAPRRRVDALAGVTGCGGVTGSTQRSGVPGTIVLRQLDDALVHCEARRPGPNLGGPL